MRLCGVHARCRAHTVQMQWVFDRVVGDFYHVLVRFCRGQRARPQDFQITAVCHLGRELQVKGVRTVSQMPGFPDKLKVFEQITGAGLILPLRELAGGKFCAR